MNLTCAPPAAAGCLQHTINAELDGDAFARMGRSDDGPGYIGLALSRIDPARKPEEQPSQKRPSPPPPKAMRVDDLMSRQERMTHFFFGSSIWKRSAQRLFGLRASQSLEFDPAPANHTKDTPMKPESPRRPALPALVGQPLV
jgi:hypothetical protein